MKRELFEELLKSIREAGAIRRGTKHPSRVYAAGEPNVAKIRKKYQLSQVKFAQLMGISTATLRNWEQGRRKPEGPARILLRVAERHPKALLDLMR